MKDNFYLVNNYLPIWASSKVSIDYIVQDLQDYYEINVKTISQISKKDFDYYLQKRFSKGATDIGISY